MKIGCIIPAAGQGKRFGGKKQFFCIKGKSIFERTLCLFKKIKGVEEIILVVPKEELNNVRRKVGNSKKVRVISGGKTRQESVRNGLLAIKPFTEIVVIHDAVRPFVTPKLINESIIAAKKFGASVVAVPVKDTVKIVRDGFVKTTPERKNIFLAQTPQTFRYALIMSAYKKAFRENFFSTDDSALVERLGKKVKIVLGDYKNIKITTKEDIAREIV